MLPSILTQRVGSSSTESSDLENTRNGEAGRAITAGLSAPAGLMVGLSAHNGGVSNTSLLGSMLAQEERRRALLFGASGATPLPPTMMMPSTLSSWAAQQQALLGSRHIVSAVAPFHRLHLAMGLGVPHTYPLLQGSGIVGRQQTFMGGLLPGSSLGLAQPSSAAASPGLPGYLSDQLLLDTIEQGGRKGRTGTFPQKLHQMLSDLEKEEDGTAIASYIQQGRAFSIHKPNEFVKKIMPKYFRMSRFSSFQRQLNLYEFMRITDGPDKGAYFHDIFIRGRPVLASQIRRTKIKGSASSAVKPNRFAVGPSALYGRLAAGQLGRVVSADRSHLLAAALGNKTPQP